MTKKEWLKHWQYVEQQEIERLTTLPITKLTLLSIAPKGINSPRALKGGKALNHSI